MGLPWHSQRNIHQRRGYEQIQYVDTSLLTAGMNIKQGWIMEA